MRQALADCAVAGVASNLDLLGRIVAHPDFAAGGIDTGFIAREGARLLAEQGAPPAEVLAIAALAVLAQEAEAAEQAAAATADPFSPWNARDLWWLNAEPGRVLDFMDGEAELSGLGYSRWKQVAPGHRRPVMIGSARRHARRLAARVAGWRVADGHRGAWTRMCVTLRDDGLTWRLTLPDPLASADEEEDAGDRLVAPIPGQVTQVAVAVGDRVKRGQVLVVLEAMKTVFRLSAPADTVVASVSCAAGEMVQEAQMLVGFGEPASAE